MAETWEFLKRIRLTRDGIRRVLGDRESSIMEVLWGREDVAVREIHRELSREEDIAYTTVMTITGRLHDKGLLTRRKEGRAYLYTPVETRASFFRRCLDRIFEAFLPDMDEAALSRFVDSMAREQPDLLEDLEEMLRERREEEE